MKHQWLAYVVVALLAIGAGVAIAGLPNDVPVSATIVVSSTIVSDSAAATTTTTVAVDTTTTIVSTTTESGSTTTTTILLPDRDEVRAATANGSGVQGAAGRVADQLEALGYVDIDRVDGIDIVEFTIIYYIDGFEEAAARMATDLDLPPESIAPIDEMPVVPDVPLVQLAAYVGTDLGR